MQALNQFSIPIKGLKFGIHNYSFELEDDFFNHYVDAPVKGGQLQIQLELDRKSNHMELFFTSEGSLKTECDRCTASIDLPISSEMNFVVKFTEEENRGEEVIFLHPEAHEINVADMIYEHLVLSLPMIKVYDCQNDDPLPCNQNVLDLLESDDSEQEVKNNPFGEALKNLKITKTK